MGVICICYYQNTHYESGFNFKFQSLKNEENQNSNGYKNSAGRIIIQVFAELDIGFAEKNAKHYQKSGLEYRNCQTNFHKTPIRDPETSSGNQSSHAYPMKYF